MAALLCTPEATAALGSAQAKLLLFRASEALYVDPRTLHVDPHTLHMDPHTLYLHRKPVTTIPQPLRGDAPCSGNSTKDSSKKAAGRATRQWRKQRLGAKKHRNDIHKDAA